jgi:hypothetical protein
MNDDFHAGDGDRRRDHRERRDVDRFRDATPKGQHWAPFAPGDDLRCPATVYNTQGGAYICGAAFRTTAEAAVVIHALGTHRGRILQTPPPGAIQRGVCPRCSNLWRLVLDAAAAPARAAARPAA